MRRDARVPLLGRSVGSDQFGIDVQHLHRLGAPYVARISPQEAVQF
jgi:hypothetical protein